MRGGDAVVKGVIVSCLRELVETEFGVEKWEEALERAGLPRGASYLPIADVDDETVLRVVGELCNVLGISEQEAADAFGRHWACTYAPKVYGVYYAGVNSAKEFLLRMDDVHVSTTRAIPNAHPPRFTYEDVGEDTLIMEYHSDRNLMPFFTGLVRGVAEYFGEKADVKTIGPNKVKIVLSSA
jgi:hypothetical protein